MTTEVEKREKQEVGSTASENITHSGFAYSPDVDVYSSEVKVVFVVDLPGVNKGDVSIQVDETDSLILRGKTRFKETKEPVMRQYELGDYYRSFQLSNEYDKDKITARFENGLLELIIPKREETKPKKIEITA